MLVVTWVSTQDCAGISYWVMMASSMWMSVIAAATLSVAGLTPITASPLPYMRPSTMPAAIPLGSSVGWLG